MEKNILNLLNIRKIIVLSAAVLVTGITTGQTQKINSGTTIVQKAPSKPGDGNVLNNQFTGKGSLTSSGDKGLGEKILGVTTYDLQTNNSVHDRMARDSAGNMVVTWTASLQNTSTWTDRGAGYSYYNPTTDSWTISPDYPRIETDRSGWPSILFDGDGGEIIISHNTVSENLRLNYRSKIGDNTASWSEKIISTSAGYMLWNRAAMGGSDGNTIHLIAQEYGPDSANFQDIANALVYYRSQDAGQTFDIVEKIITGVDSASVGVGDALTADATAIAARGNHVAIGVFNAFNDVILLESVDNGTNWTSTVVYDYPFQGFDDFWANYDTTGLGADAFLETSDGSGSLVIDDNDIVHMSWGRMKAVNVTDQKGFYSRLSFVDSLRYFRNSSPSFLGFAGNWVDANQDSMFMNGQSMYGWQSGSILTYPNLAVSDDSLYLIYNGITDTVESGVSPGTRLHHVFLVRSGDNGLTWSEPIDLTPYGQFDECIFSDILPVVDDKIRLIYHRDAYPSVYVTFASSTNPSTNFTWQQTPSDNDVVYLEITLDGSGIGIGLEKVLNPKNESSVTPNPSNGLVELNLVLYRDMDVDIDVLNMSGQTVHSHQGEIKMGRNKISMDLSHLQPGMYVVNISAGGEYLTEKIIIE